MPLLRPLRALYLTDRLFFILGGLVVLFVLGFIYPPLAAVGRLMTLTLIGLAVVDIGLLYRRSDGLHAVRTMAERLSNGDPNDIRLYFENRYPFGVRLRVIDEIPHQFQVRDFNLNLRLASGRRLNLSYALRPTERGEYVFGALNVYASTVLGLVRRRYRFAEEQPVPVYPSYIQMRKYELLAVSNRLSEIGVKKIRRIGHTMEFDQIRDYVLGDDLRKINWNATARRSVLMVNQYQDERSQNVYAVVDMGRTMQMPFEGLTLLDYAINTSLVFANIALIKQDKAGLVTFSSKVHTTLVAERKGNQIARILDLLYKQQTNFDEPDYGALYNQLRLQVRQRSLLLLFTNFESLSSMQRNLRYFRRIARDHLLVVVFFQNTELFAALERPAGDVEALFTQSIAQRFVLEKKLIVRELENHGILTVLVAPQDITVKTINKYLEIKARALL